MVEMLRNLAQTAAAASDNYLVAIRLLLVFLMCSSLIMPHWSVNANELKHRICPKTLWRIDFNNSFRQGEATLKFDIPYQDKGGGLYEAIVECEGLAIMNSTGHQFLRVRKDAKNIVDFTIKAPSSRDVKLAEEYGRDTNHSCTFELRHETAALTRGKRAHIECQFTVRTLLNRILPNCNLERGKRLIERIDVLKDAGQVQLEFKSSPNDVVTTDNNCETGDVFGHNRTQKLEEEMFGLNLPGLFTSTIVLEFYPACDDYNETVRRIYYNQQMADCYYEVFAVCQEGMISIKYEKVEFDEEVMHCQPPKSQFTLAMEHLELKFRIDSKPVVFLLVVLITNIALYVALIPFLIAKFAQAINHKCRQLEEKLASIVWKYKQHRHGKGGGATSLYKAHENIYEEIPKQQSISMPGSSAKTDAIESNRSSELGMEYDDVEYVLLGKLSAKDLQRTVETDSDSEQEDFTPLQVEVEVDIEPVTEQPRGNEPDVHVEDGEPLTKLKKNSISSLKHDHHKNHTDPHHHHRSHRHRHRGGREEDSNTGTTNREEPMERQRTHEQKHSSRPLPPPPPSS